MKNIESKLPFFVSIVVTFALLILRPNVLESEHLEDALTAMITTASLIIGFIGAVLPVVISLKNESALIRYILDHDTSMLFYRYTKAAVFYGILLIVFAIAAFFHDLYCNTVLNVIVSFMVIFSFFMFILTALRCLLFMLKAAFYSSNKNLNDEQKFQKVTSEESELIQALEKNGENRQDNA